MKPPKFKYKSIGRPDSAINGPAIRRYRVARGITGHAASIVLDLDPATISNYEKGSRNMLEITFNRYLAAIDAIVEMQQGK